MLNIEKYIKSPLNYTGGKFKLLPQIIPLFPSDINIFVDLFGGGFNVGINTNANKIVYNDLNKKVGEIIKVFKTCELNMILEVINDLIKQFGLSKTNQQGFLELRNYYNKDNTTPLVLYTLICYAFNNQIRFNNSGDFNMPFGKDRSSFNDTLKSKLIDFVNALHNKKIYFANQSFKDFNYNQLKSNDFVYCDPPYFNSTATYNENGGWTQDNENNLLEILNNLNKRKIRFALSNNLSVNPTLKIWAEKNNYYINELNVSYGNCNYHKKDKQSKDIEVLITNYIK